jgi:hypothetical protein
VHEMRRWVLGRRERSLEAERTLPSSRIFLRACDLSSQKPLFSRLEFEVSVLHWRLDALCVAKHGIASHLDVKDVRGSRHHLHAHSARVSSHQERR